MVLLPWRFSANMYVRPSIREGGEAWTENYAIPLFGWHFTFQLPK